MIFTEFESVSSRGLEEKETAAVGTVPRFSGLALGVGRKTQATSSNACGVSALV